MKCKRFLLAFVLLCLAFLFILPGKAEAATSGYYTYKVSNDSATITYCNTSISGDVTIPATLGGYPVTAIDSYAFAYCSGLTSIAIPDSVISIGIGAFNDCTSLTSVSMANPDALTSIGSRAFYNCTSLESIEIGSAVTSIGESAFYNNISLRSIWVSQSNPAYCADADGVLYNKEKTELLVAPIGLKGSYTVPDTVKNIWQNAFGGCSGLVSLTTPVMNYVYEDDPYVFGNRERIWYPIGYLFGMEAYEGGVATVQYYRSQTIAEGGGDRSVSYNKNTVYDLRQSTYYIPASLKSVTVTANVPEYAFNNCSGLETVVLTKGVASVGDQAFAGCNLKQVIYCGTEEQWNSLAIGSGNAALKNAPRSYHQWSSAEITDETYCVYCGTGYFPKQGTCGDNLTWVLSDDGTLTISGTGAMPNYKFDDRRWNGYSQCVCSVVIEDGVTAVGSYAFAGCTNLTSVIIADSVTNIGYSAFSGCGSLESLKTPKVHATVNTGDEYGGVEYNLYPLGYLFGTEAYPGGVATEQFYRYVESSGDRDDMDEYTDYNIIYYIPASLKTVIVTSAISDYAFYNCSGIETVAIGERIGTIGYKAFTGCGLKQVIYCGTEARWNQIDIGEYNTELIHATRQCHSWRSDGSSAETYCICCGIAGSLGQGTCGDHVTWTLSYGGTLTISGTGAMEDYELSDRRWNGHSDQIRRVVIEDGVTAVGSYAFAGCTNLTSVTVANTVTKIGYGVFSGCGSLASLKTPLVGHIETAAVKDVYPIGYMFGTDSYAGGVATQQTHLQLSGSSETTEYITYYIPASLKIVTMTGNIQKYAFENCTSLETLIMDEGVTRIAAYILRNCSNLKTVTIADGALYIGNAAFQNCTSLESVTIPVSLTTIGQYTFDACVNLRQVIYCGTEAQWNAITIGIENVPLTNATRQYHAWKAATCTETAICNICGQQTGEPLGHDQVTDAAFAPTCTETGLTVGSHCSRCGKVFVAQKVVSALGHTLVYADNGDGTHDYVCSRCGTAEIDDAPHSYTDRLCICGAKEVLDMHGVSRAKNLSLKDMIYMKATVAFVTGDGANAKLTKEEILENGRILFWGEKDLPVNANIDNAAVVQMLADGGVYDDGIQEYYAYSHGIAAAEYGDTIYYRTYIVIDGMEYYGEMQQYSVLTYANNQFKRESSTLKPLLAAMLNYGAAAQAKFGYKTENLANAGLQTWVNAGVLDESYLTMQWNEKLLNTPFAPSEEMTVNFRQNGAKRTARTLVLQGMVQPKLTFAYNIVGDKGTKLPEGGTVTFYYWSAEKFNALEDESRPLSKINATYTVTGADIREVYSSKYGYEYTAYFEGIPAKTLGGALYVAAVFTMADGTEYCSGVEVYSPEMYAQSMLNKNSTSATLANLLKWMVIYGEEAKNYYGNE